MTERDATGTFGARDFGRRPVVPGGPGRSACIAVAAISVALVCGVLGGTRSAVAKPAALTAAERANRGVVTYEQRAQDFGECKGDSGDATAPETVHFKLVFSGTTALEITSLDVENDTGNVYKRKKPNVWGKSYADGFRAAIRFRRDGMTLRSFSSDGSPCITYTRTIVETSG